MKKLFFILASVATVLIGCSKDKGGGDPYAVYPPGGIHGQHHRGNPYAREINGQCVDTRNNAILNFNECRYGQRGLHPGLPGSYVAGYGMNFNSGICSRFNTNNTYTEPMYLPGTNQMLCVEYAYYNQYVSQISTYGRPINMGQGGIWIGGRVGFNMGCFGTPHGVPFCY